MVLIDMSGRFSERMLPDVVTQKPTLLPWRTGLENVLVPAQVKKQNTDEARSRAMSLLQLVGLSGFEHQYPARLSGGMQQRVALARALAGAPQLLLLDEPFSALDQTSRIAVRSLIIELVAELKLTAIIVTHDLIDVAALANQLVLFEPGRTVASHELIRGQTAELARLVGLTI